MAVVAAIAALQLPNSASAVDKFPFRLTWSGGAKLYIQCVGPWYRTSGCVPIGPGSYSHHEFYYAEENFLGATGRWGCNIHANSSCSPGKAPVDFCLGVRGQPTEVELEYDGGGTLTVNQPRRCTGAMATGVLGQNGESDDSPGQDLDTYSFEGKPGQKMEIRLDRDGSGGSAGEVATLRVRAAGGAVLGQRTGAVPLSLDVTVPGTIEVAVSRRPGHGDPFRGYYELEVIPQSGDIGERKLRPSADVEQ
ncbi:MAG: hypothetical protein AB7O95_08405 [Geminicoccaceae bacterium]